MDSSCENELFDMRKRMIGPFQRLILQLLGVISYTRRGPTPTSTVGKEEMVPGEDLEKKKAPFSSDT